MICAPCRTTGHHAAECDDAHRDHAVYRSCACQHRLRQGPRATEAPPAPLRDVSRAEGQDDSNMGGRWVFGGMLAREVSQAATETCARVVSLPAPPDDLRALLLQIVASADALGEEPLSNAAMADWRMRLNYFVPQLTPQGATAVTALADAFLHHLHPRYERYSAHDSTGTSTDVGQR